ncbi:hypothetical protein Tco_0594489, partial [Tanacetum coccineum]
MSNDVCSQQFRPQSSMSKRRLIAADQASVFMEMASDHVSSDPGLQCSTTVLEQDSLSPSPQSQENVPQ